MLQIFDVNLGQLGTVVLAIFVDASYLQKGQSFRLFPLDVEISIKAQLKAKSRLKTRFINVKLNLIFGLFGSRLFDGWFGQLLLFIY